jgi:hypothetical protein
MVPGNRSVNDSVLIELDKALFDEAQLHGARNSRSPDEQINFWVRLAKVCIENPELPTVFVVDCLESVLEAKSGRMNSFIPRSIE